MRSALGWSALSVVLFSAGGARAANTSSLGALEAYPTQRSIGVEAAIAGDDNQSAKVWVEYRPAGSGSHVRGHDLMRIAPGKYAGSVFFLQPGTGYDLRVVLDDADNAGPLEAAASATTKADAPPAPTGATLWVDAKTGSDQNAGTEAAPFATIGAAAAKAAPGDSVRVRAGVYRESVVPPKGGEPGKPIWFVADGPGVVVDGSDPALEKPSWTSEGGDLYSTPFSGQTEYVAADDVRLYDYPSLAELKAAASGIKGGFAVEGGKLYVRLPDGGDPSSITLHVAILNTAFLLDTIAHVVIEGFEMRYFGSSQGGCAVDIRDTHDAWVRKNAAHHMNGGFRIRKTAVATDNVIEQNSFRDTSVWTWPWDAVKAHTAEASAISVQHGRGNVVRLNQLEGSFNGIDVGAFGTTDPAIARDTDVYGNVMRQHGDDGLEPEGACVNVRFWHNAILGVKNAVSVSPIEVGPTWLVRNLVADYQDHVLKVNNGSKGWILVYHTTGVPLASAVDAQAMAPTLPFGPFVSRNNIYQANRYVIESALTTLNPGVSLDHDALYTTDTTRFVKWADVKYADLAALKASGTIEANGFQVAPSYDDVAKYDYDLTDGHPLVDQGTPIPGINTELVVGAGPDVGAFERGGVSPWTDASPAGGSAGAGASGGSGGGSGGAGAQPSGGAGGTLASGGSSAAGSGEDDGGCGCALPGAGSRPSAWLVLLFASALLRRRARR